MEIMTILGLLLVAAPFIAVFILAVALWGWEGVKVFFLALLVVALIGASIYAGLTILFG